MTAKTSGQGKATGKKKQPKDSPADTSFFTVHSDWLQQSVQEFFSNCNWQGQPLAFQDAQQDGQPLPLTVPVAEFFRALPWEGKPAVGSMPKPSVSVPVRTPSEPAETTLADLVDLF